MSLKGILATAFAFFLIGIVIRIVRIATMPVHVRWELYPIPHGPIRKTCVMLSEIFLLKGVFEQNPALWVWSWIFHGSLYLLTGVAFLSLIAAVSGTLRSPATSLIAIISQIAYIGGTVGSAGLIIMRLASPRMRPFTSAASLLNVMLLLAVFLSGLVNALLQPDATDVIVKQAGALLRLNPAPSLPPAAVVHLILAAFFVACFPFTQMAHAVLKYFTYHSVRWDDSPLSRKDEEQMRRYLAYPVSWSAPHIQGGGRKSWIDLVSSKDTNSDRVKS